MSVYFYSWYLYRSFLQGLLKLPFFYEIQRLKVILCYYSKLFFVDFFRYLEYLLVFFLYYENPPLIR